MIAPLRANVQVASGRLRLRLRLRASGPHSRPVVIPMSSAAHNPILLAIEGVFGPKAGDFSPRLLWPAVFGIAPLHLLGDISP